jgi:DNA polymerase-3 subunit beta
MDIQVGRLREALKLLQPVVPKKPTIDALKNILLKDGEASATDLEDIVTIALPEVEGACLIPHHSVLELLKYVPMAEMLTIESRNKAIHLSWRGGNASYDVPAVEDYPPLHGVRPKAEGYVDGDMLVKALMSVVGYCATDTTRPTLNGVTIAFGADGAEVVGADGFRMAYLTLPMSFPAEDKVIIPSKSVRVLEHLWGMSPASVAPGDSLISQIIGKREINLALGDDMVMICARFGRITLISRLVQGTPPNYRQLIPSETPLTVQLFAGDLERAVRRLRAIAEETKGITRFTWTESAMTVSAKSDDKGSIEVEIEVKADGGEGRVALNAGYVLDYVRGKEGLVTMGATSPTQPVVFRHGQSPLMVIMPMFVQWPAVAEAEQVAEQAQEVTEPEEAEIIPEDPESQEE